MRRAALVVATSCALLLGLAPTPVATATTGPTPLANPPLWEVTKRQASPFIGRFRLAAPHGRRLIGGAYVARFNEYGYLQGSLALYLHGAGGRETSWVGATYEYHPVGRGQMVVDVVSPDNDAIFARMRLAVRRGGRLTGTLVQLQPPLVPAQRITLRRIDRR
jgi:hypothetical protein